jgi:hypothetical protein
MGGKKGDSVTLDRIDLKGENLPTTKKIFTDRLDFS